MANLITAGLTGSLLTAFNHAKLAERPMMQASNELQKLNPDVDKLERSLKYGSGELTKSEDARNKAAEELEMAAKIAREEEKIKDEQRLAEKTAKPTEEVPSVGETNNDKVIDSEAPKSQTIDKNIEDKVELSPEALKIIAETPAPMAAIESPKVYTKAASLKSAAKATVKEPKLDVSV